MNEESLPNQGKLETIYNIYHWNQQLIDAADRKVAALILINAVVISFSATWNLKDYDALTKIITVVAIVIAAFSTVMFFFTLIPRISPHAGVSVLHYRGILRYTRDEYLSKMMEISDAELTKDYLGTIYSLSLIQTKKNYYLKLGSQSLIISIILLALSFIMNSLLIR
ncbi:MAG: DUF5706 domain-containing protein [Deltaproteobacteria bacterium]|nr:DUF5706 domain-containing protein [Deltaproteobacteria bacterium]